MKKNVDTYQHDVRNLNQTPKEFVGQRVEWKSDSGKLLRIELHGRKVVAVIKTDRGRTVTSPLSQVRFLDGVPKSE